MAEVLVSTPTSVWCFRLLNRYMVTCTLGQDGYFTLPHQASGQVRELEGGGPGQRGHSHTHPRLSPLHQRCHPEQYGHLLVCCLCVHVFLSPILYFVERETEKRGIMAQCSVQYYACALVNMSVCVCIGIESRPGCVSLSSAASLYNTSTCMSI